MCKEKNIHNKKKILAAILMVIANFSYADDNSTNNDTTLNEVEVVATKAKNKSTSQVVERESGNFIPSLTTATPPDTVHSTAYDLNDLAGVSVMGNAQSMSQNISIGGLQNSNIYVSIDDLNNYFTDFGHNQTNQLLSSYLFKEVSATQTGSNITYGSGNVGGAVNFTTIDPEDLLHGSKLSTQASIGGNSATMGATGNAAIAARTGKVSYLLDVVAANNNDMTLGNTASLPYSANTNYQVLGKVGVDITNSQKLKFSFLGMQNQGQYPTTITNTVTTTNPPSIFKFQQSQSTIDYSYNPDNPLVDLNAKVYYQTNGYQSLPISNAGGYILPQDITVNTAGLKVNNLTKVAQQNLLYGIEYTNIWGSDAKNAGTMMNFPSASQQLYGVYLQDSWDITRTINVTAGTRYNNYQSQSGSHNNNGGIFTNQLGVSYHFLPDWTAFAGYSEGFKAPTIQDLYLGGNHPGPGSTPFLTVLPNPGLQAEVGHNKTVGMTYDTAINDEQHFTATATAFLNNVSNYILNSYVGQVGTMTAVNQNINIPDAVLYGYVLSAKYNSPWVVVDTNFTTTYGVTQSDYTAQLGRGSAKLGAGSPLPIPQAKGFLGLAFPIDPIDSTIEPMVNYAINQPMTPPNVPGVPGYVLLGAMYKWQPKNTLKGLEVTAGIDNILNENYQTFTGQDVFPGLGRNVYAQVSYKY